MTKFDWKMFKIKYFFWLTHPIGKATCRVIGHKWWCFKVVPTDPQEYFWWCKRCMLMTEDGIYEPCGRCDNGCSY